MFKTSKLFSVLICGTSKSSVANNPANKSNVNFVLAKYFGLIGMHIARCFLRIL